jgi:hypothetical protein
LFVADVFTLPLRRVAARTNPLVSLATIPGTVVRVWIASLEPPLSVRAEGSEERTLLYACARFDRSVSMHLVRRTYVDVSAD